MLTLVAAVGCNQSSPISTQETAQATPEPQSEPETTVAMKPIFGEADNTFSLSVPFESVDLAQGEEKAIRIGINRGENFREQVAIKTDELPMGVTLETVDPLIEPGSADVNLMLKAASDAALGDFTFKVTGHTASSGPDFSHEIKLTVTEREESL
jgi:uncharacterized membrane protein